MEYQVSIIIPIYNSEEYLKDCITSVVNQTYKNLEILLINDGSTDRSIDICNFFAKKDHRIKVFNNINRGVSYSRNFGIDNANGDYILFIDSDDTVENNYVEELVSLVIYDADLGICGITDVYENKKILRNIPEDLSENFYEDYFLLINLLRVPFAKIYKMRIIKNNNIRFPNNISKGEDQIFNFKYYVNVKKYRLCRAHLYNYSHKNINSLSKINDLKAIKDSAYKLKYEEVFLKEQNIKNKEYIYMNHVLNIIINSVGNNQSLINYHDFKEKMYLILNVLQPNFNRSIGFVFGFKRYILLELLKYRMYLIIYIYIKYIRKYIRS